MNVGATKKPTVLLVEDDPVLRYVYEKILEHSDEFEWISYTGDFRHVADRTDWAKVDVILCDQYLGRHALGSTILEWVAKNHPRIWRVLLTGDSFINANKIHCDVLLLKPAHPDEIISALRTARGKV